MTLTDRAASLFGEIAAAAGYAASATGRPPLYLMLPKGDADTLLAYFNTTHPFGPCIPVNRRIAAYRATLVSGLEVHINRDGGPLRVC